MTWFKCFVRGENFPGELVGEDSLVGFFTTRYVEANTTNEAEIIALESMREDPRLLLVSPPKFEPKIYFEEFQEVDRSDVPSEDEGFVWYLMEEA